MININIKYETKLSNYTFYKNLETLFIVYIPIYLIPNFWLKHDREGVFNTQNTPWPSA